MTMLTVDLRCQPSIETPNSPSMERLYVFLSFFLTCTCRDEQAVEAHVPPGKRPFVIIKDEGSVLVFCVPVLFLCLSVVCVLVSVCKNRHVFMFCVCACICVECLCASVPQTCAVCTYMKVHVYLCATHVALACETP